MDWMTFTIKLMDILVWPIVVTAAVYALRQQLRHLIPFTKKLKYKDFEMEFGQELKAAKRDAEKAFPEIKRDKKAMLIASADSMPSASIMDAWREVDQVAEKLVLAKRPQADLDTNQRYKLIEDLLIELKIVDTPKSKLFNELRTLRNKVAHAEAYQVSGTEAVQYIELCYRLIDYLQTNKV
ncbi:hypothetical protein C2869_02900 [Saccharobesus litoralis]|uniref:DUF4145 domain-containing protein n=1 Tax=Saccharobesus litoralis TaxID=2172099 RepID=A0A2S0VMM3_9ALTE|nr:hypothetical protein [Saccharobesus litoralis]AWB65446.1 hypothetical protein C2869_02900 [Saccharobesus litoralis]